MSSQTRNLAGSGHSRTLQRKTCAVRAKSRDRDWMRQAALHSPLVRFVRWVFFYPDTPAGRFAHTHVSHGTRRGPMHA